IVSVPRAVDIIIPNYGAADELRDCIASVAAHTDLETHRVILAMDGPQELPSLPAWTILRNERRIAFAASLNRGIAESTPDVVLLNSDTIVTPRWIEKLIDAAYSHEDIGTVTPLSNNATLCSVPRAFEENLIPDIASFAERVERVSMRSYPRIPTGVGFCLYIRRALLDDIGLFDAKRFADGYGEENEFCLRALDRGWLHIADDATFIYHPGHRSFGDSRSCAGARLREVSDRGASAVAARAPPRRPHLLTRTRRQAPRHPDRDADSGLVVRLRARESLRSRRQSLRRTFARKVRALRDADARACDERSDARAAEASGASRARNRRCVHRRHERDSRRLRERRSALDAVSRDSVRRGNRTDPVERRPLRAPVFA